MKKSKIIVPALALLAFTTISSVSGTVAWFTASRGGSFTASNFKVVNPEGNMAIALGNKIGTTISGTTVNVATKYEGEASAQANTQVDASFDHKTPALWQDIPNDNGGQPTSFTTVSLTEAKAQIENHVFMIISWTATFTYTFGADTADANIYFNAAESTFTVAEGIKADADNSTKLYTYRGFRVAMIESTGAASTVWAPQQLAAQCKYITKSDGTKGTYKPALSGDPATIATDGDLIASDCIPTKIAAGSTGSKQRADYIGTFKKPSDGTSTTVVCTFYAWFEGTDPNVKNDVRLDAVSLDMKFYVRNNATA